MNPSDFRAALSRFASGVTIITARDAKGRDVGMTVSAFSSLSLEPPLVLACVDDTASVAPVLAQCEHFAVNILAADQSELSRRFARQDVDRFEGIDLTRGVEGLPLLSGALAQLSCAVEARHPGGDHTILVGRVLEVETRDANPLLYFRGAYGEYRR
ncbi:MAG: flavin reductase family protein [Gemmatimonadaceae bacterium]|nr:flavin reductase family protein [Gemmatimonadaceae bacterium]